MAEAEEILQPDEKVTIGDREITVKEFTFRQVLELGGLSEVIALLDDVVGDGSDLSGLIDALYVHPAALEKMLLLSTGQEKGWLDSLSAEDGDNLVMVFWGVNSGFFMRRLVRRRQIQKMIEERSKAQSSH